jgi:NADPH2:quinone reductase
MLAIRAARPGGPEVLEPFEAPTPTPGPGQLLVRHDAIGVNFMDTYQRAGGGVVPVQFPAVLGQEAAGFVEAIGDGVSTFLSGDRVAYLGKSGAYAEYGLAYAPMAIRLPAAVSFEAAAAGFVKGMTAEFLLRRCYPLKAGETILVHSAAGGVGAILVQWAKALGARVIGVVGAPEKSSLARRLGCDDVILYRQEDIGARVREITAGRGVDVAYDSVGQQTFEGTLASLAKRGLFVSYGQSSGPIAPFAPVRLLQGGSLFFTRPMLFDYIGTRGELEESADALFTMIVEDRLKIEIGQTFKLALASQAHEALEACKTVGSTILVP